jgi:hypothetical protein
MLPERHRRRPARPLMHRESPDRTRWWTPGAFWRYQYVQTPAFGRSSDEARSGGSPAQVGPASSLRGGEAVGGRRVPLRGEGCAAGNPRVGRRWQLDHEVFDRGQATWSRMTDELPGATIWSISAARSDRAGPKTRSCRRQLSRQALALDGPTTTSADGVAMCARTSSARTLLRPCGVRPPSCRRPRTDPRPSGGPHAMPTSTVPSRQPTIQERSCRPGAEGGMGTRCASVGH